MACLQDMYLLATALAGVVMMALFILCRNRRQLCMPPGPAGLPVIGNLLDMGQFTHRGLAKLAKVHGGFLLPPHRLRQRIRRVLPRNSTRDPAGERRCVPTPSRDGCDGVPLLRPGRHGFRALRPLLAPDAQALRHEALRPAAQPVVAHRARRDGRPGQVSGREERDVADVGELVFNFSSNVTFRAAFGVADRGRDDDDQQREFVAIIKELSEMFLAFNVADFVPFLGWMDLNGVGRRMRAVRKALDVFVDRVIDEHVAKWRDGHVTSADMVDDMIAYLDETPAGRDTREDGVELRDLRLTRDNVKGLIMDIMFGGTETAASTLEWAMCELLRHPDELRRAQDELAGVGVPEPKHDVLGDLAVLPRDVALGGQAVALLRVDRLHHGAVGDVAQVLLRGLHEIQDAELGVAHAVVLGERVLVEDLLMKFKTPSY